MLSSPCLPRLHIWAESVRGNGGRVRHCRICSRVEFWLLPWKGKPGEWW